MAVIKNMMFVFVLKVGREPLVKLLQSVRIQQRLALTVIMKQENLVFQVKQHTKNAKLMFVKDTLTPNVRQVMLLFHLKCVYPAKLQNINVKVVLKAILRAKVFVLNN